MAPADPGTQDPPERVLDTWKTAQAVCFDVDSTLCEDESIDELAAFLGMGDEVAAMTASAMGGTVLFQDALRQRLDIMQTSQQKVQEFLAAHPPRISKGIPELVDLLQSRGTGVFLVSGGFRVIIDPIADILKIPRDHVFANKILFDEDGSYAGFDETELTSRSGGKAAAARLIKEKYGYSTLVMVGDGATDLEARQPGGADIFIGYGGVVERPTIAGKADWYIYNIEALIAALH
ncbi:g8007 [Coccomyxa elongata]